MPLTTAEQVRLRIQDQPTIADVTIAADGLTSAFMLDHRNPVSGTAYVMASGAWSAVSAAFDATGCVVAGVVPSANSGVRFRYVHSTFSDAEIGHFTAVGGSVAGAALEAVGALMFDSLRRAKWAAPDGTSYDDTAAMQQLRELYKQLKEEDADNEIAAGNVVSWSLGQQDW